MLSAHKLIQTAINHLFSQYVFPDLFYRYIGPFYSLSAVCPVLGPWESLPSGRLCSDPHVHFRHPTYSILRSEGNFFRIFKVKVKHFNEVDIKIWLKRLSRDEKIPLPKAICF